MSDEQTAEQRIEELIGQLTRRVDGAQIHQVQIELLRIEVEFLTITLQSLLSGVTPFFEARQTFLLQRLQEVVESVSKPKLVVP